MWRFNERNASRFVLPSATLRSKSVVEDQHRARRPAGDGEEDASRGVRAVEAAKADDRWDDAYAGQAAAVVPDDLQAALDD